MKSLLACVFLLSCASATAGSISIEPAAAFTLVGSPVSLAVNVSGLTDLFAFQFDVGFNPAVLAATSVTEGPLFAAGVSFSPGVIDNTTGSITFIADSLSGGGPGISADGSLVRLFFQAIGVGSSGVDLSNVILLDSALHDITATAMGGTVTIGGSTVPEPATFALVLAGMVAVAVAVGNRRRHRLVMASLMRRVSVPKR